MCFSFNRTHLFGEIEGISILVGPHYFMKIPAETEKCVEYRDRIGQNKGLLHPNINVYLLKNHPEHVFKVHNRTNDFH